MVTAALGRRLQSWAPLGRLHSLDLVGEPLESDELQELARSPLLANLRALRMGYPPLVVGSAVQERGIRALMGSEHLTRLAQLHLRGVGLRERGMLALARSPCTRRLTKLALHLGGLTAAHVEPLFRSDALQGVAHLGLQTNQLGDEGAKLVARCGALGKVRFLSLRQNRLSPEGVRALAGSPHLHNLTGLDLGGNELGAEGLQALLSASFLPGLRSLDLSMCKLHEGDLKALCACPGLSNLRKLDLDWNPFLGDEDVKALAGSPHLRKLVALNLIGVEASREALEALYESANVKNLLELSIASSLTEAPGADDLFFASPLPEQLLRLIFFPWPNPGQSDRYREALGDRLVVASDY
jgi:hypothetical protein